MQPVPQPARTEDLAAAFRLVFKDLGAAEQETRVANALHLVQRGELNPEGVHVLRGRDGLLGALVCLPVPGASALVWPPGAVDDDERGRREDALIRHAVAWLRGRGVKLAQSLLTPDEAFLAQSLERNGFTHVTNLWYLWHNLEIPVDQLTTPAQLRFESYNRQVAALFHETLLRTYEGTLDCPEVNGVRTLDEVIQGHQAQGTYDPERWWLALDGDRPVGVTLVTELPESGDWEVAYMGVVPDARRRGFGREILLAALCEARAAGISRVTLSVDTRNLPAWNLYRGLGFAPYDQRAVFLAVWR